MARGGDRGGGSYGGSGKGNNGPGAAGARGGRGSPGNSDGIGGSGVGWSGSGNESRNEAAHQGADFGGRPGTVGGGGRSTGGSGQGVTRGLASEVGAKRRSSALSAFGRFGEAVTDVFGGLTQGIADVGESIGESLGYGREKAPTFTGGHDYQATLDHAQAQREKGEALAMRDQGINTVSNLTALNPTTAPLGIGVKLGINALSNTLTGSKKQGYEESMERGLSPIAKTGITRAATGLTGVPGAVVSGGVDAISMAMMSNPDQAKQRTRNSRRSNAIAAFSPGNGSSGSRVASAPSSQPQTTRNWMWEPASYGVGDYGSHVRGLLLS